MKKGFPNNLNKRNTTQNLHKNAPRISVRESVSEDMEESISLRLFSPSNHSKVDHSKHQRHHSAQVSWTMSHILSDDVAFQIRKSVNIVPDGRSNGNVLSQIGKGMYRNDTLAVIPDFKEKYKDQKIFDFYDFDEIDDELGEGMPCSMFHVLSEMMSELRFF